MAAESIKLMELLRGMDVSYSSNSAIDTDFKDVEVTELVLDSRLASSGCGFVALQGTESHGLSFAGTACAQGAVAILHDGLLSVPRELTKSALCIEVPSLREQLGALADRIYNTVAGGLHCSAVTGTNGKTSCVQNIAALLNSMGVKAGSIGTLGWGIGGALKETGLTTPDVFSVHKALGSMLDQGATHVALEASSHALVQGRLDGVSIHTAVFTNLSRDHLDFHGSFENYAKAKAMLFERTGLEYAVLNADDPYGKAFRSQAICNEDCLSYSTLDASADVYAENIRRHDQGMSATIRSPWGSGEVKLAQIGLFNLQNMLASIASVSLALSHESVELGGTQFSFASLLESVAELATIPGRMQLVDADSGPRVVIDYAHTPDGLLKALQAVKQHCDADVWVVFGCGGDRDKGKRAQMASVAKECAQHIVVTSDNPRTESPEAIIRDIEAGLEAVEQTSQVLSVQTIEDRQQAIEAAVCGASENDWVLVAGKGHENYQHLASGKVPFDDMLVAQAALAQRVRTTQAHRL